MKLGSNDISAVKIGSTDVSKVYIGSTEVWSSFTGLLDTYTGAAAAYSLRQLKSGVTNAIEVRRASDNTTQDIGFVDGELDTTSLASFCSGTDGFVTTWYDQSGNGNDATQTTAASQPQIVSSGSVITENGKPAVQFDGSDDYMTLSSISLTDRFSEYIVNTHTSVTSGNQSIGITRWVSTTNNRQFTLRIQSDTEYDFFISDDGSNSYSISNYSSATVNTQYLHASELNLSESQEFEHYRNNVLISSTFSSGYSNLFNSTVNMELCSFNGGGSPFQGYLQEVVFYASDQSSNRTGIETNINDFYSIYYVATNSEYQDVLDYADSQGYQRPSYAQQALQDALVGDLKDAGVWSKLDTFYVFATDGDREYAAINWKDPNSFEITEVNSPTFTTDVGFTGNGSSAYLDPSYNQGTDGVNWSNPNGSYGVYVHTAASSDGMAYAGETAYTYMRRGTRKRLNGLDANNKAHGLGFHLLTRNSTNFEYCFDGIVRVTLSLTTWSNASDIMFLGQSLYSDGTISIGFFGGDLSSEQGDFYTAVDSYMTSI